MFTKEFIDKEIKNRIDVALARTCLVNWSISKEIADKFRQSLYKAFEIKKD